MAFLSGLLTRLKSLLSAAEFLKTLPESGRRILKGRLLVVCLPALLLLVLGLVMLLAMNNNSERKEFPAAARFPEDLPKQTIPSGDLFLGEEPDFIPPVLLERERRQSWTAEDASPFWQDPLERGEEPWRERIESAIDELLEGFP